MEKKLIKKVAAEIEENGVGGVKPMLTKKLKVHNYEPTNYHKICAICLCIYENKHEY